MAIDQEHQNEKLLDSTEKLLDEVLKIDVGGMLTDELAKHIESEALQGEIKSLQQPLEPDLEAYVEITVSEDEMEAEAFFYPPAPTRETISFESVEKLLNDRGIRFGVDWEAIQQAVFRCNTERIQLSNIIVACGRKPVPEMLPYLEIETGHVSDEKESDVSRSRIDFKEASPFILVKKGQVLARWIPKKPGEMGSNVRGASLPFTKIQPKYPKPGKNTMQSGDAIVALCDGRYILQRDHFWVNEVLDVQGNVDYHTGHIDFPGDVIIQGEIQEGFRVTSGGSIYCMRTINASEIVCKKDLVAAMGIIGRKNGVVKAGGNVHAKYVENCYIEARDSIYIEVGAINSALHTLNKVEGGPRGAIIGGKIFAQNGVSVTQIGTERSPKAELHLGIDFSVQQKLIWIRDKNIALAFKLKEVEKKLEANPVSPGKLPELKDKIKGAIHQLNQAAKSLVYELHKNEAAELFVKGTISAGTYIEICHVSSIVDKSVSRMVFKLDKTIGKIVGTHPLRS